jgi:hypothetical protein
MNGQGQRRPFLDLVRFFAPLLVMLGTGGLAARNSAPVVLTVQRVRKHDETCHGR